MKKSKFLSIVLSVLAIMLVLSFTSLAKEKEGVFTYTVKSGKATITSIKDDNIVDLVIPETLGGYQVTAVEANAIGTTFSINSISFPSGVTSIPVDLFRYCYYLMSITVDPANQKYSSEDGVLFNKNKTTVVYYPANKEDIKYVIPSSVTSIGDSAFASSDNLRGIVIPDSVTTIGVKAFENSTIDQITIGNGLKTIKSSAFASCHSLTDVILPEGLTTIENSAFHSCFDLENITIPSTVVSIGKYAFQYCYSLEKISIPAGVKYLSENMFEFCERLKTVELSEGLLGIGEAVFWGCESLADFIIPESVKTIGRGAFCYCKSLEAIVVPFGVKSIESETFQYCDNLEAVLLSDSVESIGISAFNDCEKLKYLLLGSSMKNIGLAAFSDCPLVEVYYNGNEAQLMKIYIDSSNISLFNATVYVVDCPKHSFTKYVSNNDATYLADGTKTAVCDKGCGVKDTVTVKGSKLVLAKAKPTATQTNTSITLSWKAVPNATGYRVYSYNKSTGKYTTLSTIQKTSGTVKNLKAGTEYNYLVRAYIELYDGTIAWAPYSASDVLTTGTLPEKVTTISATQSNTQVKLTWKGTSGSTGYRVYEYDSTAKKYTKLGTVQKTNGLIKNLKSGTEYKYLVRAYKQLSNGTVLWAPYSVSDVFTTGTCPNKATGIAATQTTTSIKLTWKEVSGATGYRVYEYDKATGKYTKLGTVQKLDGTLKNLKAGTTHGYLVRAYKQLPDGTVLWAAYSASDVYYTATKAVAPTLKATAGTKKFTLSWNKVAGATNYEVWYATSENGTYKKLTTVTGTTYSKSCTSGKTYYFKVRAMTTVNGQSIKGEASTAKGVTIK